MVRGICHIGGGPRQIALVLRIAGSVSRTQRIRKVTRTDAKVSKLFRKGRGFFFVPDGIVVNHREHWIRRGFCRRLSANRNVILGP